MIRKEKLKELDKYIDELKSVDLKEIENDKNNFLTTKKYSCLLNNGKTIIREKLIKNGKDGSAAIILPVTEEGNVILVVQPRVFSKLTVGIEFPAGYIEENENPHVSACRELEEETGYKAKEMIPLAKYYQDEGCSGAFNYCYLATGCKKVKEQHLDKDEFIRYFECSFEEALDLYNLGYICGANSTIALERAKSYFKEKIYKEKISSNNKKIK